MSLEGAYPFLFTAMIMWASDSFAYFAGRTLGKHKMAPQISPKKTWEGTIGGALLAVLAVVLSGKALTGLSYQTLVIVSATAAITGTIGDLIESKFKRMAGVKDSGNIMPGHGGFLDRFDAFIFVVPFVYVYSTIWFQF